ncbi:hypothetical protein [Actinoplanes derwentensis]|uniref:hypothetical protein n=1 Tax=Actinoplanes derwentensis TaxID=113562 RepID=UPI0012FE701C|nr:hypothetical protein [Actinoplanes derwentensis]
MASTRGRHGSGPKRGRRAEAGGRGYRDLSRTTPVPGAVVLGDSRKQFTKHVFPANYLAVLTAQASMPGTG